MRDPDYLAVRHLTDKGIWLAAVPLTYGRARVTLSHDSDWPYIYRDGW